MLKKANQTHSTSLSIIILTLVCMLFCSALHAKQLSFKQTRGTHSTQFDYEWRKEQTVYRLSFSLENMAMNNMPNSPPRYNQSMFQDVVYAKVMQKAKEIDTKLANIKVLKNKDGLSFKVRGRNPQEAQLVLDKLKDSHKQAQQDYWQENYFRQYQSPTGASSLRHDHARYTQKSKQALIGIVDAIKDMQQNPRNSREFIEILLSWIQSIPYNTLQNRLDSNGAGFISPRDLLVYNQGDCDSKSTLMASVLKAYNNNINMQMVYLPNHALLAVAMLAQEGEQTIDINGVPHVLIEPTGPAQYNIGEAAESSLMALRNQQFDVSPL